MCGVAGYVGRPDTRDAKVAVAAMCEQMRLRGPDDNGVKDFSSPAAQIVLGSTRLAIIDPSASRHQPMRDPERGTTVVFNGMIYNFRVLRAELESAGERFRSDCDTEVVLRAYGRLGRAGIRRLHGVFAFAIWDERKGTLLLARDRVGYNPAREGYKLKEYMAAGLSVVASPVGHVPRLVRHGTTGYLARSGNEWVEFLLALVDDPALRAPLGRVGRRLVEERYATEHYSRKLADLFCREVRRKSGARV